MIGYKIGFSAQELIFTASALSHFRKCRQMKYHQPEAGGQLFANFIGNQIIIVEATGPRPTDRRTPSSYIPDRKAEQAEIYSLHQQGLHYVGDWHTHAQEIPLPSFLDEESIADYARKSVHSLNGFVLVIVGKKDPPAGLYVMIHDGNESFPLQPQICVSHGV